MAEQTLPEEAYEEAYKEAYKRMSEFNERFKAYEKSGADINGSGPNDKEYAQLMREKDAYFEQLPAAVQEHVICMLEFRNNQHLMEEVIRNNPHLMEEVRVARRQAKEGETISLEELTKRLSLGDTE